MIFFAGILLVVMGWAWHDTMDMLEFMAGAQQTEVGAMNWKRGLLRMWALGSLLWLGGWLFYVWESCRLVALPGGQEHREMCFTSLFDDWMSQPGYFGWWEYLRIAISGLSVPLAVLLIGCGVWWVRLGLKKL